MLSKLRSNISIMSYSLAIGKYSSIISFEATSNQRINATFIQLPLQKKRNKKYTVIKLQRKNDGSFVAIWALQQR